MHRFVREAQRIQNHSRGGKSDDEAREGADNFSDAYAAYVEDYDGRMSECSTVAVGCAAPQVMFCGDEVVLRHMMAVATFPVVNSIALPPELELAFHANVQELR